jgi:LysM repeat protein
LGRHSKQPRVKLPSGVTIAAAPTIAGVAAAFCLTPPASASAVQASAAGTNTLAASEATAGTAGATAIPMSMGVVSAAAAKIAEADVAAAKRAAAALPDAYKVRRGDSLSSIAVRMYHDRAAWTVLYWRNRQHIHWADQLSVGQVLQVPPKPARIPRAPTALGPVVAAAPSAGTAPAQATPGAAGSASAYAGGYPGGAFGACVVARESGGNAQIMNASGHYGLYQFSAATWAAYGGNPADFGHASVAEQNRVFANALAAGGQSNWAPYDGC